MDLDEAETKTKPKAEDKIYTRIKSAKPLGYQGQSPFHGYECKECHEDFRNKIALTTHSYSHNRKYIENTEDFDINSSQNMKEFYITDKGGNYIKDIDEATYYSLEEIKIATRIVELRVLNIRLQSSVIIIREPKKTLRLQKYFSILTTLIIMRFMKMETSRIG